MYQRTSLKFGKRRKKQLKLKKQSNNYKRKVNSKMQGEVP